MRALFQDHPEVLAETARVAALCEFDFAKRYFLPQYPRPPEFASDTDLLPHLGRAGATARYGQPLPPAGAARLDSQPPATPATASPRHFPTVYGNSKPPRARRLPVCPRRRCA